MPYQFINEATLGSVVRNCAAMLSLVAPKDIAGNSDSAISLLVECANMANAELVTNYEWEVLTKVGEMSVVTDIPPVPGQAVEKRFDLPEDFLRFIDQTQWNQSMRFPAVGPVSPQGWMTYLVFPVSANFTLTWQVRDGAIWFLNPPLNTPATFRFMYISKASVEDADDPTLYKNFANKEGDKFLLDGILVTLLTRLKWLEAKGFDSSAAARDYATAWDARIGLKKGANILTMSRNPQFPYIGVQNLPDTNYGVPSA